MSLKLVCVNVERSKHLELVLPFIKRIQPDVLCLQELHEPDRAHFERLVGPCVGFAAVMVHKPDIPNTAAQVMGTAIFTSLPVSSAEVIYYSGSEEHARGMAPKEIMEDIPLVAVECQKGNTMYRINTTHFTWSAHGEAIDAQRADMRSLLALLDKEKEIILCGDFNAPRGGEIFAMLERRYKDNIPLRYVTSLDRNLHRAGHLNRMVDGLFTTSGYRCSDVRLVSGISDHMAIVANVKRV